jgi:OOP family OmpA-OmpF porin
MWTRLKNARMSYLADSDGDGVIDAVDEDPNTPPDVPVDTKGRVLDSDKDGVADYKDKEPYYPPRAGETVNTDGVVTNPISGSGVTEARVKELIDEALDRRGVGTGGAGGTGGGGGVTEMFLPMIHFASESNQVKYSDYGTLAGVARVLKGNPNIRLVVSGHTDQTGPEALNDWLSYQRANSIIEHLVTNHGIGRGRLVLAMGREKECPGARHQQLYESPGGIPRSDARRCGNGSSG